MPQNLSVQFVCSSPKFLNFNEKRLHWASVIRGSGNSNLDLVWLNLFGLGTIHKICRQVFPIVWSPLPHFGSFYLHLSPDSKEKITPFPLNYRRFLWTAPYPDLVGFRRSLVAFVVAYKSRIITAVRVMPSENMYRTSAIISRGLYIFYPIFHCGLYCRAVSIADNLCTKQGNPSIF